MKKSLKEYPIHSSEFDRPPTLVDTTKLKSKTLMYLGPDVEQMLESGVLTSETFGRLQDPMFGDFTSATTDFEEILFEAAETSRKYEELPVHIKKLFKTPEDMAHFLEDPRNREEAIRLGLLSPQTMTQEEVREKKSEVKSEEEQTGKA